MSAGPSSLLRGSHSSPRGRGKTEPGWSRIRAQSALTGEASGSSVALPTLLSGRLTGERASVSLVPERLKE